VINLPQIKAGIDTGGSLIKITFQEQDKIHYKKYPINKMHESLQWLQIAPNVKAALTGGKAHIVQKKFFPSGLIVPEFQATCEGARLLMLQEGKRMDHPFLLVNIGTGTSWHLVDGDQYERILGSGIGGGTFTGLGSMLTKADQFQQLVDLAAKGEKENVDMLVKDIYESDAPPIDGHLTAANFAKGLRVKHSEADRMAALTNMIAETLVLLTLQAAVIHQVKDVVFIGSTLVGNTTLKNTLNVFMDQLGLSAIFLKNGEYCGAVGAFLSI
jgi:type II pantothenate kinase